MRIAHIKKHIYIYMYIYILGLNARFARTMSYGIILRDYIRELHYEAILSKNTTRLYYGIILRDYVTGITGLHNILILWDYASDKYFGIRL